MLTDNNYQYWNYYLYMYPNSNFTTELCTRSNYANGTFYLIKRRHNFQEWINRPSTDRALGFFSITHFLCSNPKHRYSFRVEIEDDYYLVYYNNRGGSSLPLLRLNVAIAVEQFQYSTSRSDLNLVANSVPAIRRRVLANCSIWFNKLQRSDCHRDT